MSLCCVYLGAAAGSTFRAGGGSTHAWSRLGQEGSKGLSHVLVVVISGVTTQVLRDAWRSPRTVQRKILQAPGGGGEALLAGLGIAWGVEEGASET